MARLKIEISGKFLTTISIPVRITDINYGNHTGNDAMVSLLHEARAAWLRQNNFTELNIDGTGLILSDLMVNFKKESFYGDVLEISLYANEVTRKSFDLIYLINAKRVDVIQVAIAKTTMISYDYELKKVVDIPTSLNKLIN